MLSLMLHRPKRNELMTSELFNETTFYMQFKRDLEQAKKEIVIESPFITGRRVKSLLPSLRRAIQRGASITINTRELDEHDGFLRLEAEWAVPILQTMGIRVLLTKGHHRKLAIIDRKVFWEGSHNILSQNDSCEIMRRINSPAMAQQMIEFIRLGEFI